MSWKEQRHMRQFAKQTALDIKASHCIRVLWARQPHYGQLWASGDNEAREKFPGVAQSWFPETLPLRYVTPRKWGSGMSRVYHVKYFSVTFLLKLLKNSTWAPPEAPALLVPTSASDPCHLVRTHVWNGTNFRLWPSALDDGQCYFDPRHDTSLRLPPQSTITRRVNRRDVR